MENTARKYNIDVFIAALILILPFLIYTHLLFSKYESELIIFNYSIKHWLFNNETFIWIFLNDVVPFVLLLMMFFTTRNNWKLFLLPMLISYFSSILLTLNVFVTLKESLSSIDAIVIDVILILVVLAFDRYIADSYRKRSIHVNLKFLLRRECKISIKLIRSRLISLHDEKCNLSIKHYFKKLYYFLLVLDKNLKGIYYSMNKVRSKNKSNIDLVLILIIILMSFVWYAPYLLPKKLMYMEILGFTIETNGFVDVRTFIWFVTRKFIVIIFLSIWFITSGHWWKYAIFSPLIIFSYQFWEAFQDVNVLEAMGNIKVFPLVLINILLLIGIAKWIKYRTNLLIIYELICKEVDDLMEELKGEQLNEIGIKFKELKEGHSDKDVDYYKTKLKALEQELLNKLDLMKG